MFSKPFSHFEEPKTIESVFQSEPEVLPSFEMNYKFLERHKKTLSLAKTRKRENPVNAAHKMVSQSSTKQDEEVRTEEVTESIVTYTEEEINTFNCDVKLSELSLAHFQFCHQRGERCKLFSFSRKLFRNLKKDVKINGL